MERPGRRALATGAFVAGGLVCGLASGEAVSFADIDRAAAAQFAAPKVSGLLAQNNTLPAIASDAKANSALIPFNAMSTEAVASMTPEQEQECIDNGMEPSQVLAAKMYGARRKDGTAWTMKLSFLTDPMDPPCAANGINRYLNMRVQMQNTKQPKRWTNLISWMSENDGLGFISDDGGTGGTSFSNNPHLTRDDYLCINGNQPPERKVRVQLMNAVKDDGVVVAGPKVTTSKVTVYGAC